MIIGLFLFCVLGVVLMCVTKYSDGCMTLGIIGIVLGIILTITTVVESFCHSRDLGNLRAGSAIVKVQEERVERLQLQLNSIKQQQTAFMNADAPISAIVTELSKATSDLAAEKTKVAQAVVSISTRKAGPMWFVVSMYGDH
jgi:hypothetical protein